MRPTPRSALSCASIKLRVALVKPLIQFFYLFRRKRRVDLPHLPPVAGAPLQAQPDLALVIQNGRSISFIGERIEPSGFRTEFDAESTLG